MRLIYIAGAFRAPTRWKVIQNIRRAEFGALEVAQVPGCWPVCPHTNTGNFDGELNDQACLDGTLEMMRRCDAVYLLPNWHESAGTRAEVAEAKRLGIPVFHVIPDLRQWVDATNIKENFTSLASTERTTGT